MVQEVEQGVPPTGDGVAQVPAGEAVSAVGKTASNVVPSAGDGLKNAWSSIF